MTDDYIGWLNLDEIGDLPKANHRILSLRSIVYSAEDIKSIPIIHLPLGSQIHVVSEKKEWCKIIINQHKIEFGFVPKQHVIHFSKKVTDWVNVAETFLNTPYKWGGRDSLGVDCSALVQLSLQAGGVKFPRNSSQQRLFNKLKLISYAKVRRGNLIFWEGHVGIILNHKEMIHSNSFSMMVSIEKTVDVIKRIAKPFEIYEFIN